MKYTIYILIILCGVLPIVFQRATWVRIASLVVLVGLTVFYLMGLQTSARLAVAKEYQATQEPLSEEWIDGTYKTRKVIEGFHPLGILLFASLIALAAKPVEKDQNQPTKT